MHYGGGRMKDEARKASDAKHRCLARASVFCTFVATIKQVQTWFWPPHGFLILAVTQIS